MIGESVTILRRVAGTEDRYGKPTYTWSARTTVDDVLVAPGKSVEGNEAIRNQVDTACTLLFRGNTAVPVGPFDRVIVRGVTWFVNGRSAVWDSGSWPAGSVLELDSTEG